jgi:hypothetical protein
MPYVKLELSEAEKETCEKKINELKTVRIKVLGTCTEV